jgi:Uma2 family endonuclease
MALMVLDRDIEKRLKAEREANGLDRYDEVWEGTYMMAPLANNEHQDLQLELASAIKQALRDVEGLRVQAGGNVSDRDAGWLDDYRIPDVVVVFPDGRARDCNTHWCGGPDFCAEIASPGDRSRDKVEFYGRIGVREFLIVDREPWSLELFRLTNGELKSVGRSDVSTSTAISSEVLGLSFKMLSGARRPQIVASHRDGLQQWTI